MGQHYYHTGQFAQKASVSIRTLRYYDKVGLLSPSQYTEAGYRLYTDTDFLSIQQILALKFLGFSLEELKIPPALKRRPLSKNGETWFTSSLTGIQAFSRACAPCTKT